MAKILAFCTLFLYQLSFADVEFSAVTGQFLNVHGANWNNVASSQDDWKEVRFWHEKIIESPESVQEVYPQPGMADYIQPIAIHSYGKLIGEGKVPLDERSKELLNKLALDIPEGSNIHSASTLEAIGLTNSPWGVQTLRSLISENQKLNQQVLKEISSVMERLESGVTSDENIDTDYEIAQVDYSKNHKEWSKEIYQVRKLATKLVKNNPNLKTNPVISKISTNANHAAKLLTSPTSKKKINKTVLIKKETKKDHHHNHDHSINNKKDKKRSIASEEDESTPTKSNFWLYLSIGFLFFLILIIAYKKLQK